MFPRSGCEVIETREIRWKPVGEPAISKRVTATARALVDSLRGRGGLVGSASRTFND